MQNRDIFSDLTNRFKPQPRPKYTTWLVLIAPLVIVLSLGCLQGQASSTQPLAPVPFTIDANYPGGNIIVERIEGDTVRLKQDLRDTEGWWFYWSFRVKGAATRKLRFQFSDKNPIGVRGPAVSTDAGKTWSWLGPKTAEGPSFTYEFAPDADEVRFCFAIPYLETDLKTFLKQHAYDPHISARSLSKSKMKRNIERIHAGRLNAEPKYRVLLTARHHACESIANYALEGILQEVLAGTETGLWFRRNVEVLAIPFMDKDGVEQGDQGKNRRPHDHNRDYIAKSIYPSVAALRTFVPNWSNGKLKVALDLHCPYISGPGNEAIYMAGSPNEDIWTRQQEFAKILQDVQTGPIKYSAKDNLPFGKAWNTGQNYGKQKSAAAWAGDIDGVTLSSTIEIPYANASGEPVTAQNARAFGRDLAQAIRTYLQNQQDLPPRPAQNPIQVKGVFPKMTVMAKGLGSDSEAGIGALIPWAEKLWATGYVAHIRGHGLGLHEITEDMKMTRRPEAVTGTFTNRMAHWPSGQAFIGPHAIDADGNVRTIEALKKYRLTSTMRHLKDPENMVYFLGMEGGFWEVNVHSLKAEKLFDLVKELEIRPAKEHFKAAYTAAGRVVVANNTYDEREFLGQRDAGRLAEWDGKKWTVIERNPFVEVHGNPGGSSYGSTTIYATGWTKSSVVLRVFAKGKWDRYLLPKGSHSFDHAWNTEWMRIRHAVTERLLMDAHGIFYELPPQAYEGKVWGIKPICSHLRVIPDFCHWRGMFVMASDQIDHDQGQPQSGLWFGNIDDLWKMGKPTGWGGPWWQTPIEKGQVSDPFLMTGFDKKVLHLAHDADKSIDFAIEIDFLGNGTWMPYKTIAVSSKGYEHHEFPDAFSAHWVRIRTGASCKATAYFMYN